MKLGFLLLFSIAALVMLSGCLGNQIVPDSVLEQELCEDELGKTMDRIESAIELTANQDVQTRFNFELPDCFKDVDSTLRIGSIRNIDICSEICGEGTSQCVFLDFSTPDFKNPFLKRNCLSIPPATYFPKDVSVCNQMSEPVDLFGSIIKPGQYTLIKNLKESGTRNTAICAYTGSELLKVDGKSNEELMNALLETKREEVLRKLNAGLVLVVETFSVEAKYILFSSNGWEEVQTDFMKDRFGVGEGDGSQFASRVSQQLIFLLRSHPDDGFLVSLDAGERKDFELMLDKIFDEQQADRTFFKLNSCDEGNYATCTGTFDLEIDFSENRVSESDYQTLPKIVIEDSKTGNKLSEPIFKRGKVILKFPIRLFKALAGANEINEVIFNLDQGTISKDFLDTEVQKVIDEGSIIDDFELVTVNVLVSPVGSQGSDVQRHDVTLTFKELDPTYTFSYAYPERIDDLPSPPPEENTYSIVLTKFY